MTPPLATLAAGAVSSVGLSAPATCAAIRCGINNFDETHFIGLAGDWLIGSEVQLEQRWHGLTKLAKMAALAVRECLGALPQPPTAPMPVVLCLSEEDRPGRLPGLGGPLLLDIERELGAKFHPDSTIVAQGRVGGAIGLLRAQKLVYERQHAHVLLVGVDSYLTSSCLLAFEERDRLQTAENSDGFVPGEAAAAIVFGRATPPSGSLLTCTAPGFARESATIESGLPLRGDGMVQAVRMALDAAGISFDQVDHRISDVSGEQYRFKEVALSAIRLLRSRKADFGVWHPADCLGETGAAAFPIMLSVLYAGARKAYLPGPTFLAQLSNDDDKRAAVVIRAQKAI
jgi:3-oxoacyl-[acyl-carrier-protein] synthase-1